jgi:hypothetical protein
MSSSNRALTILAPRHRTLTLLLAISALTLLLAIGALAVAGADSAVAAPVQTGFARPT